ncbi:MerR family transcriptional regulator [Dysosmobacter sp.]|uniref:MerR family transcriptional regulator n=1 Tax=Dysosmobacter sp. TaxID=2591382 RepID=UPI002A9BF0B0|nr:MerR family transcriptional regulator [Dysosmobacter sp.]MDY5612114.1 MerR family transcriptional regulator [Dysosmobacter sp.]
MLKIGEFSKLSRISIRMLRHYDEIGLLTPETIDPFTGYRYYSASQLSDAGRITALKDMGFKLCDAAELLKRWEDRALLEQRLLDQRQSVCLQAEEAVQRLRLLDTALERLRKDEPMKYDVTVKTIPERQVASVRQIIPCYQQEGELWNILMRETVPLHVQDGDPVLCCATFHDKEYKETDVDVEVHKTVRGNYPDTEHVKFRTVPQVLVASAVCKGSYALMDEVNAAVASWVEANGYAFDGPMFNIYHVSPHETNDPNEFVTEVCYPVRRK